MTDELDPQEVENPDETLDSNQENEEVDNSEELTKAQEIANNQKIRAEKAEAELKKLKATDNSTEENKTPKNDGLSAKDVIALRDVHEEDVDYLLEEATLREKTVSELKKDPYMNIILKTRADERATAEATSTAGTKRGTRRDTDEAILDDFDEGKVPESDEGIRQLVKAQQTQKMKEAEATR